MKASFLLNFGPFKWVSIFRQISCRQNKVINFIHSMAPEVFGGPVVSKFNIKSQAVTFVWVRLQQVIELRACPSMALAVDRDI